ncbi:MAG TPA: NUDIX domain-containing protein [Cytophagaceae bacterium]|jgi:8-oxo-dGTP diphosphatase|nr:NUDIX domain-containing protein [Cytophagaceae bacterium]
MKEQINNLYGNRIRVRVCGICIQADKILLIRHSGVGEKGSLWVPPGGGVDFGESVEKTLVREYKEETGLDIKVKEFLFVNEYIAAPLHAVELFFNVEVTGGKMAKGTDPEMSADKQLIQELKYWNFKEIATQDPLFFHSILRKNKELDGLINLKGFFTNF